LVLAARFFVLQVSIGLIFGIGRKHPLDRSKAQRLHRQRVKSYKRCLWQAGWDRSWSSLHASSCSRCQSRCSPKSSSRIGARTIGCAESGSNPSNEAFEKQYESWVGPGCLAFSCSRCQSCWSSALDESSSCIGAKTNGIADSGSNPSNDVIHKRYESGVGTWCSPLRAPGANRDALPKHSAWSERRPMVSPTADQILPTMSLTSGMIVELGPDARPSVLQVPIGLIFGIGRRLLVSNNTLWGLLSPA